MNAIPRYLVRVAVFCLVFAVTACNLTDPAPCPVREIPVRADSTLVIPDSLLPRVSVGLCW